MADMAYTAGKRWLVDNGWADLWALLLDEAGTYVFDADHTTVADLAGSEVGNFVACPNYTRLVVPSLSEVTDFASDRVQLKGGTLTWAELGPVSGGSTISAVALYFFVTDDSDSVPFLYLDSVFPRTVSGSDFNIQFDTAGIAEL